MQNSNLNIQSSYQKDINRLRKKCITLNHINSLRKHQITQFNMLVKKLLDENRITKEEVGVFIKSKKEIKLK